MILAAGAADYVGGGVGVVVIVGAVNFVYAQITEAIKVRRGKPLAVIEVDTNRLKAQGAFWTTYDELLDGQRGVMSDIKIQYAEQRIAFAEYRAETNASLLRLNAALDEALAHARRCDAELSALLIRMGHLEDASPETVPTT